MRPFFCGALVGSVSVSNYWPLTRGRAIPAPVLCLAQSRSVPRPSCRASRNSKRNGPSAGVALRPPPLGACRAGWGSGTPINARHCRLFRAPPAILGRTIRSRPPTGGLFLICEWPNLASTRPLKETTPSRGGRAKAEKLRCHTQERHFQDNSPTRKPFDHRCVTG
jgi:hypothetical protein